MQGPYIATAPNPKMPGDCPNFAKSSEQNGTVPLCGVIPEFRRAMRVPIGLPDFTGMVHLGASLLLRTDPELALYGRYLISSRLRDKGFEFRLPKLSEALADLFAPPR